MTNIEEFLNKSAEYKQKSVQMANLFEKSPFYTEREKADLLYHCADSLILNNIKDGTDKFMSRYCRNRFCPQCQYRKSVKQYGEIIQVADKLGCAWLHMVLTIRNCNAQDLSDTISLLYTNSTKLYNNNKRAFKGMIRCCEVTYNRDSDSYHPHLHCLVSVNKSYFTSRYYIKQSALLQQWRALINRRNDGGLYISKVTDKCSSVAEVAKYCLKPLDSDIPDNIKLAVYRNIFTALKGRRLIQTFGNITPAIKEIKNNYKPLVAEDDILCSTVYYYNGSNYEPTAISNKITNTVYNLKKVNSLKEGV